jgi:hypothetical protein
MNTTHENICNITFEKSFSFFFGVQDNNCGSEVSFFLKKKKRTNGTMEK